MRIYWLMIFHQSMHIHDDDSFSPKIFETEMLMFNNYSAHVHLPNVCIQMLWMSLRCLTAFYFYSQSKNMSISAAYLFICKSPSIENVELRKKSTNKGEETLWYTIMFISALVTFVNPLNPTGGKCTSVLALLFTTHLKFGIEGNTSTLQLF